MVAWASLPGAITWSGWLLRYAVVVVQLLSQVRLLATPWTTARQAFLPLTISWTLPEFISIELVMPSNHLILCFPFSFCLQSLPAAGYIPGYIICKNSPSWRLKISAFYRSYVIPRFITIIYIWRKAYSQFKTIQINLGTQTIHKLWSA